LWLRLPIALPRKGLAERVLDHGGQGPASLRSERPCLAKQIVV
jgi:hypothetical protein